MGSAFPELLPVTGFRQRSDLQHIQRRYRPGFAPGYLVQQKAVLRRSCHGMGYQIVMGILPRKTQHVNAVNDRLCLQRTPSYVILSEAVHTAKSKNLRIFVPFVPKSVRRSFDSLRSLRMTSIFNSAINDHLLRILDKEIPGRVARGWECG